jgi:excinuclease UvrABC nuclease subunit
MNRRLARAGYVYRCFDAHGCLLYIGAAVDVRARLVTHRRDQRWWRLVARVEAQRFATWQEAERDEKAAILREQPPLNVYGRGQTSPPQVDAVFRSHDLSGVR